ncbi:Oidioi.mRNA.OKI2018_I69.chr2.g6473.t1.cds [Oikopleura dioica]|uniref:Oidioi.mRNA.OKI2018_I69.chr2.g6473.t1.cds n=1 Tax=Oikopleura dioica TaxID=34765 RepID=A0ABN7TA71_OIKDI|nr:Oidioi.mRNA.OKI2018_I69.chr2.g6473.t1.cds [Oikopleura dioica]
MSGTRSVTLSGGGPWGFRIQGGKDFNSPLTISRVNEGGKAHASGLITGETIKEINGTETSGLVHVRCQQLIKNTGLSLTLTLDSSTAKPSQAPVKYTSPPPKVPVVTKSQFTTLHQQVSAPKPEPKIEKPSAVAAALARRSPSPPPVPSPPPETVDFPAPPASDFPKPPPSFQNDFPKPPPMMSSLQPDPVKTYSIPKVSNIVDPQFNFNPSSYTPVTPSFSSKPKPSEPSTSPSYKPTPVPATVNSSSPPRVSNLSSQLGDIKLANDPAARKFVSPAPPQSPIKSSPPVSSPQKSNFEPPIPKATSPPSNPPPQARGVPVQAKALNSNLNTSEDSSEPTCAVCFQKISRSCFERDIAHSCAKCNKKIIGDTMHALNQTWHMNCFVCIKCKKPFEDGVFHWQNEQPYCVDDYNQLFATFCRGCNMRVEAGDQYIEALGESWHDNCFTCSTCHIELKNVGFYNRNNRPVCKAHAR